LSPRLHLLDLSSILYNSSPKLSKSLNLLGVDVLNCDLEAIEGVCLGDLDLLQEATGEVLQNYAIGGGEEGEHVGDKMALVGV
jgi:hypothetical protein